jgi:hypothetical protein
MWEGNPAEFIAALKSSGFLDERVIHDWADYAGGLIRRREANAQRMRDARAKPVQNTCDERAMHVQGLEKSIEEKSIEERERVEERGSGGEVEKVAAVAAPRSPYFKIPEKAEIASYFVEIGSSKAEARKFYDHHTARGWMLGRVKMKDWQAAARTWHSMEGQFQNGAAYPDPKPADVTANAMEERANRYIEQARAAERTAVPMPAFAKSLARGGYKPTDDAENAHR